VSGRHPYQLEDEIGGHRGHVSKLMKRMAEVTRQRDAALHLANRAIAHAAWERGTRPMAPEETAIRRELVDLKKRIGS
jgi:hypothetical protein